MLATSEDGIVPAIPYEQDFRGTGSDIEGLDVGAVGMNSPGLTVLAFGLESCVVYGGYGEVADGLTVMGFSEDRIPIDCPDATSNDHRIFSYLASKPALALEGNQITLANEIGSITFTQR